MSKTRLALGTTLTSMALLCGCGSDADQGVGTTGSHTTTGGGGTSSTTAAGGGGTSAGGGGGDMSDEVHDPNLPGPYTTTEKDDQTEVAATGHDVPIHAVYPTSGPEPGPYPVVVIGHGFQLAAAQYYAYATHLASFGYVAVTVDFPASFVGNKHIDNARDLLGGIDWAGAALADIADSNNAGTTGHSLGGKAAVLAATMDPRVKATITLDPVDSAMGCAAQDCPDVSELLPIPIPTGFIGETLDSDGGAQPCAPAADNFTTFFAKASAPSIQIDVLGASHMSSLDNKASCGLPCSFCKLATVDDKVVHDLASAFIVAFYERHLKGNVGYDT